MNRILKLLAWVLGLALLYMSIGWSKDGFKFDFTQAGMDANRVMAYGVILALTATLLQFIFATAYKELNITLLVLGGFAYVYSIGTNISGIAVMQGGEITWMTWVLGIIMDVAPEPMIAWGLGQALAGDFLGNLFKALDDNKKPTTHKKSPVTQKTTARHNQRKPRVATAQRPGLKSKREHFSEPTYSANVRESQRPPWR